MVVRNEREVRGDYTYRMGYRNHMPDLDFLLSLSPDDAKELFHNMDGLLEYKTVIGLRRKVMNVSNQGRDQTVT